MKWLVVLFCSVLCGCAPSVIKKACCRDSCVQVSLADTDASRAQGLMFVDSLPKMRGMLFLFPEDGTYRFWMKNMIIPLDIVWIDSRNRIVDIHTFVPPCTADQCQTYSPASPIRYVLEVNAGFADAHHFKRGDQVVFK